MRGARWKRRPEQLPLTGTTPRAAGSASGFPPSDGVGCAAMWTVCAARAPEDAIEAALTRVPGLWSWGDVDLRWSIRRGWEVRASGRARGG
jgi:hypothetical protein